MSYRICRQTISTTFTVEGQLCKIFLDPFSEYEPGHWLWNTGFAIGKSSRQLNDWYNNRKNKRARAIRKKMVGSSGMKPIIKGFEKVLEMRWVIPPGDAIVLDCTSGDPERQFHAWSRWHKYHRDWTIDADTKEFYWFRPPYLADRFTWDNFKVYPVTPKDKKANCLEERYFDCFYVVPKVPGSEESILQSALQLILDPTMQQGFELLQ